MIITSTLKISLGLTLAASLLAITYYISNENTQFETIENPITESISTEYFGQRLSNTNIDQHQPLVDEFIPLIPMEVPKPVEVVYDIVVFGEEITGQTVTRNEIKSIREFHNTCDGSCGRVMHCVSATIIEQPIEEEDESLLSEQIFSNPYLFEAKAYPNPTSDNTTVELDIEIGGNFTIQLFDMNGKLIQRIYDGHLDSGRQSFNADLYDYMPGLYFISIQSLFQQETLKIQKI